MVVQNEGVEVETLLLPPSRNVPERSETKVKVKYSTVKSSRRQHKVNHLLSNAG